ncbi:MAG: hypothetical protein GX344_12275 [Intrasporangiaceae bacterium]|nr:hypothetical protein [Intrasporangiaceae bacterium]
MVTAELAVGIVTLLLVLSLVLGALRLGMDRATAVSVAATVAREAARDGDVSDVWQRSRAGLPQGAGYSVTTDGRLVTVAVSVPARGALRLVVPAATSVSAVALRDLP